MTLGILVEIGYAVLGFVAGLMAPPVGVVLTYVVGCRAGYVAGLAAAAVLASIACIGGLRRLSRYAEAGILCLQLLAAYRSAARRRQRVSGGGEAKGVM